MLKIRNKTIKLFIFSHDLYPKDIKVISNNLEDAMTKIKNQLWFNDVEPFNNNILWSEECAHLYLKETIPIVSFDNNSIILI